VYPTAVELCDDIDSDCDGEVDEGCDNDGDDYCDAAQGVGPGGSSACPFGGGDCNDDNAAVNPAQAEICGNGLDDNCNGTQNDPNAIGCATFYADGDDDTFGSNALQCLCEPQGSFKVGNSLDCDDTNADANPNAAEICNDIDDNCDGVTDEGCDDDADGFCDLAMTVDDSAGLPAVCPNGKDDCNDGDASVYPGKSAEACDGIDDDCDGDVDNSCDEDGDGYCNEALTVSVPAPAVCLNGGGDCNDFNSDQNPGASEVCGNGIDDNCNGSTNDVGATNCTPYFFDQDGDNYGLSVSMCMCEPAGNFKATEEGDCDDTLVAVNPGATELCGDGIDNNCNGTQNDDGADGCTTYYFDGDGDGFGLAGLEKCLCVGEDDYTATDSGDCNDADVDIAPGKEELCNNKDDDCDGQVDEGCDSDGDNWCDAAMTTVGFPNVCPFGGGDCNDTAGTANPGFAERCDGLDNNCDGQTDEGCDDDGDDYCDAGMVTVGTPAVCPNGGADCNDGNGSVNPGMAEDCGTTIDDNCNGVTNEVDATGCTNYGLDKDGDDFVKVGASMVCLCSPDGDTRGTQAGDCNDANALVNPSITEICDDADNDCDGVSDDGCDDDGDGYCDVAMTTVGKPSSCINGGGDCADDNQGVNPGEQEVCGNSVDENCDGSTNGIDAVGCSTHYLDNDNDGWAVNVDLCVCAPWNGYKVTDPAKVGDCDDTSGQTNPDQPEVCGDGIDNNCNGSQNDEGASSCVNYYVDADFDGYGGATSACLCVAQGAYITALGGDCDETDATKNPGENEMCDAKDNNCDGSIDEGCDDDNDNFCDADMLLTSDATCVNSTKPAPGAPAINADDCDDLQNTFFPGATEICNDLDVDCDGTVDNGCDDDKDGFCDENFGIQGNPAVCASGGGDCNDSNNKVAPSASEICDGVDNDCDGQIDEGCDDDGDDYCDSAMGVNGTPPVCPLGAGDCNDDESTVNPGAEEVCDALDNNCAGGVDEVCNDDDQDGYCVGAVPVSIACPNGGGDCDDNDVNVNPGSNEDCSTEVDDNCNGTVNDVGADNCVNWYTDLDDDGYGTGGGVCQCTQDGDASALQPGDCDDGDDTVNPGATEVCDGIDNDCVAGVDGGCDDDGDQHCDASMLVKATASCANTPKPPVNVYEVGSRVPLALQGSGGGTYTQTNCPTGSVAVGVAGNYDGTNVTFMSLRCRKLGENGQLGTAVTSTAGLGTASGGAFGPIMCPAGEALVRAQMRMDGNVRYLATDCKPIAAVLSSADNSTSLTDLVATGNAAAGTPYLFTCPNGSALTGLHANVAGIPTQAGTICSPTESVELDVAPGDDCDDNINTVNSTQAEICDDLDNNCNGVVDEGCDADNDNYCDAGKTVTGTPATCTSGGGDCNDAVSSINPGATENCTTPDDDNCNGSTNELNGLGCTTFYFDDDGDGYGTSASRCYCAPTGKWSATQSADCDDSDPAKFPGAAAEVCDNIDNNCNGVVDEGCDKDGDGYCDSGLVVSDTTACPNTVISGGKGDDCDDTNSNLKPGATEACDDVDNDCNGSVDNGCDKDGDNFCDSALTVVGTPAVCPLGGGDCDDTKSGVNPNTTEVCDSADNNCNGIIDEAGALGCSQYYYDGDQDGFGVSSVKCTCGPQGFYTASNQSDCNDNCPTCNTGQTELCDGVDNDCDGQVDEGCDNDGDDYCDANMATVGLPPVCPKGGGDCDDNSSTVNPGHIELCNNKDDNCNGIKDENAAAGCGQKPNATVACVNGSCQIESCDQSFFDLNGFFSDGCECNGNDAYEPNETCSAAKNLGTLNDNDGFTYKTKLLVEGKLVDSTDHDWYRVYAQDSGDSSCDRFNLRVQFLQNPGNGLRFDIHRGGCPNASNGVCCSRTNFNWFTNYKGYAKNYYSSGMSEYGQCPCTTNGSVFDTSRQGWNDSGAGPYCDDYNVGGVCIPTGYRYTRCQNDSAWFYIHVKKYSGAPACSPYRLELTNGVYGAPGNNGKNW
jgi:hypothetical protein